MKRIIDKYINGFLALVLLMFYLIMSWILHKTGYEHSESLFTSEKILIIFDVRESIILTLGTTFPTIVYLSSLIFTPFGYLFAPVLASIILSVILYYTLLQDFKETSRLPSFVYLPLVSLLFFLHPGLLYAAISGRGVAAILLFFYYLLRSLFRYYKTQTTFYLSMASIYLSCLVFCDFNFIWLLLAFFPFIVLVSLEGLKINKDQPPLFQYFEAVNNGSQRRKLTNRAVAIYIILFMLPASALLLFCYLNATHAGVATYFLHSQYANWHVMGNEPVGDFVGSVGVNSSMQTQLLFQFYLLLLNPLVIVAFFYFKGKLYEFFTLLAPFILIAILIINSQVYFLIEYYLIFLILALVGLSFYAGKQLTKKITWFIIVGVGLLNVFTGIYYFKKTDDEEEKKFFSSIRDYKNWNKTTIVGEEVQIANYINSIADANNKVMIDDAAAFKIVVHLKRESLIGIELPSNKSFGTIVENPIVGVKYICVAKISNKLKNYTVLNSYNLGQMESKGQFVSQLVFQTENWAVYRIREVDE